MYGIYANIGGILMVTVTIAYMDPMGFGKTEVFTDNGYIKCISILSHMLQVVRINGLSIPETESNSYEMLRVSISLHLHHSSVANQGH